MLHLGFLDCNMLGELVIGHLSCLVSKRLFGDAEGGLPNELLAHLHLIGADGDLGGEGVVLDVLSELVQLYPRGGDFVRDAIAFLTYLRHGGAYVNGDELQELFHRVGLGNTIKGGASGDGRDAEGRHFWAGATAYEGGGRVVKVEE